VKRRRILEDKPVLLLGIADRPPWLDRPEETEKIASSWLGTDDMILMK
jgi:hypothetical protein